MFTRGVRWCTTDFEGYRTLLIHNHRGELVAESRMRADCADAETERHAWAWLDRRFPAEDAPKTPDFPPLRMA